MVRSEGRYNPNFYKEMKKKIYNYNSYYEKFGLNYNFYLQAQSYVKALQKKEEPFVNIKEGIESVKVVDAIYKSIELNKAINIK